MNTNNEMKQGRTIWDFIIEKPFLAIIMVLAISLPIGAGIIYAVNKNYSVKSKIVEITPERNSDSTNFLREIVTDEKTMPNFDSLEHKKEEKKERKNIVASKKLINKSPIEEPLATAIEEPKKTESQIVVHENNGIVGNTNYINIPEEKLIFLSESNKEALIKLVDSTITNLNQNKDEANIQVSVMMGNDKAFRLGNQIIEFLKGKGYKVFDSLGFFNSSPPVKGVKVGPSRQFPREPERKSVEIQIGYI